MYLEQYIDYVPLLQRESTRLIPRRKKKRRLLAVIPPEGMAGLQDPNRRLALNNVETKLSIGFGHLLERIWDESRIIQDCGGRVDW